MIRVEEQVEVGRDPATAYAFLSAVERYPDWLPGVISAAQTSPGPVGPGTTFQLRLTGPSGPIEAQGVVVTAEPGHRLAIQGTAPQGRVEGALDLVPVEAGTIVRIGMQVDLAGIYRFAEGLVSGELRRGMPGVLERVKREVEEERAP